MKICDRIKQTFRAMKKKSTSTAKRRTTAEKTTPKKKAASAKTVSAAKPKAKATTKPKAATKSKATAKPKATTKTKAAPKAKFRTVCLPIIDSGFLKGANNEWKKMMKQKPKADKMALKKIAFSKFHKEYYKM